MANGLLDLLMQAREFGRGARADLENSINYYIPPELRGLLGFAAEANPVVSMERAGQDSQRLVQPGLSGWERMAAAGDMASNMASVLVPMAAGRAVGKPVVQAAQEGLLGLSMTPEAAALRQFGIGDEGSVPLFGGGKSDPTATGWTFRDMRKPVLTGADEKRVQSMFDRVQWQETELPIVRMIATQPTVNPDFAETLSSQDLLPTVVQKGNELFVRDGHHRLVKAAEAGNTKAKVALLNLDPPTDAPLLDYRAPAPWSAEDDALLAELYGTTPAQNSFGEGWQDVYHWSRAPESFSEFDPSKSTSAMSQLGPHVGTPQAAEARYMGWSDANNELPAQGFTMPLRADLSKPFLNPSTNQPWSEMDLEMFISAVADENGVDRRLIAPIMRERLASEGYTSIPYLNDVEDAGSVSNIMLTDRGGQSDAVLRSRFAAFDPRRARSGDLSAAVAAGVPLGLLAMQPEQEQY